jgi:hypothetical protein
VVQHHFGYIKKLTKKTLARCHWRALKSSNLRSTRGIAVFLSSSCVVGDEMEFASVALSFSSTRSSSVVDEIRLYISLSSSVVDDNPPLSLSRRHLSSATRDGIRVCRALSLSLNLVVKLRRRREMEFASVALSLSRWGSSIGDETWKPRLSLSQSRRHVSSATRQGIRVSRSLSLSLSSTKDRLGLLLCSRRRTATRHGIRVSRSLLVMCRRGRDMESASLPFVVGVCECLQLARCLH